MAFRPNKSFRSIIDDLGLSTGLQLCLDAGDLASYPGSGQKWLDQAQRYDFFLGATSGAAADDPTFNGVAGDLKDSTYWALDGTQFFRYDTTNETWMQNLHKNGATYTFVGWVWFGTLVSVVCIAGTIGDSSFIFFHTGIQFRTAASKVFNVLVENGTLGAALNVSSAADIQENAWNFVAASYNEATPLLTFLVNGEITTSATAYASPDAGAASFTMEIGAGGNSYTPLPNTSRIGFIGMWNRALSAQELMNLYQYPGATFSSQGNVSRQKVMVGY